MIKIVFAAGLREDIRGFEVFKHDASLQLMDAANGRIALPSMTLR